MNKEINIMGKVYKCSINAYTPLLYKKTFKSGFMEDLSKLSEIGLKRTELEKELQGKGLKKEEIEEQINIKLMGSLDDFIEVITQIAYILILGNDKNFKTYEDWMSEQETLSIDDSWITEVTEFAVSSFQR